MSVLREHRFPKLLLQLFGLALLLLRLLRRSLLSRGVENASRRETSVFEPTGIRCGTLQCVLQSTEKFFLFLMEIKLLTHQFYLLLLLQAAFKGVTFLKTLSSETCTANFALPFLVFSFLALGFLSLIRLLCLPILDILLP